MPKNGTRRRVPIVPLSGDLTALEDFSNAAAAFRPESWVREGRASVSMFIFIGVASATENFCHAIFSALRSSNQLLRMGDCCHDESSYLDHTEMPMRQVLGVFALVLLVACDDGS